MSEVRVKTLLTKQFDAKNVEAALKHFKSASEKYASEDWEGVGEKAGKFVEAVTKALMGYCKITIPKARDFSAGQALRQIEQIPKTAGVPDGFRLVIPRACIFIYEIASNRGGRHDAGEVNANEMDASAVIPIMSWILAELIRLSSSSLGADAATSLIQEVINKIYPYYEEIDGRVYVNYNNLSAPEYALLLLYNAYPNRIEKEDLINAVVRHGPKRSAAAMAISRLNVVDEDKGTLKLRANGRQKAEELLKKLLISKAG